MKYILMIYFLSSGFYSEKHISAQSCNDALIEATLVKGADLWTGVCVGPGDDYVATAERDIAP